MYMPEYYEEMDKDETLKNIYKKYYSGSTRDETLVKLKDGFLEEVAERFGWTVPQAYVATDHLFRPPNYN